LNGDLEFAITGETGKETSDLTFDSISFFYDSLGHREPYAQNIHGTITYPETGHQYAIAGTVGFHEINTIAQILYYKITATGGGFQDESRTCSKMDDVVHVCPYIHSSTSAVEALAVSPDGTMLIAGNADNTLQLWSLPGAGLQQTLETGTSGSIINISFTSDGNLLAVANHDDTVALWSLPGAALQKTLNVHYNPSGFSDSTPPWLNGFAMSPGSTIIATSGSDGGVQLWSFPDGTFIKNLPGDYAGEGALAMSPDGSRLVSAGSGGNIHIWSLPEGTLLNTLNGDATAIAISPDGSLLASAETNGRVQLWSLVDGALLKTMVRSSDDYVFSLAFNPDGTTLAVGLYKKILLWSIPDGALQKTLAGHTGSVSALAFTKDGKELFSGDDDGRILFWSLPEGAIINCADSHINDFGEFINW
jgi:WD40 repeat protein